MSALRYVIGFEIGLKLFDCLVIQFAIHVVWSMEDSIPRWTQYCDVK